MSEVTSVMMMKLVRAYLLPFPLSALGSRQTRHTPELPIEFEDGSTPMAGCMVVYHVSGGGGGEKCNTTIPPFDHKVWLFFWIFTLAASNQRVKEQYCSMSILMQDGYFEEIHIYIYIYIYIYVSHGIKLTKCGFKLNFQSTALDVS